MTQYKKIHMPLFILMASITFMAILSELVPSGILPLMSQDLGVSESKVGLLVGYYAIASALCSIPLITATLHINRKFLLMTLLVAFALSNFLVGWTHSYTIMIIARIIGGAAAGVLWPMISAYGMRLVPKELHGRAITIIMSGTTFGLSLGMPLMTSIGQRFGWRIEYYVLGGLILTIALLGALFLPSISGEKVAKENSPLTLLKQPSILLVLALTLLAVVAHYAAYTYITAIVDALAFSSGIQTALILFGIGSILSVWIAGRYVDKHLYLLSLFLLSTGVVAMGLFLSSTFIHIVSYLAFLLWGVSFGALVTLFQAAITRQVTSGTDIATSLQSSTFNLAIMIGSWVGSILLSSPNRSALSIVTLAFILLIISVVVSYVSKPTLDK